MNNRDPFTPEERELAGLLPGRMDVTPSPEADAAVIAAARAALQGDAAPPRQGALQRPADGARRHRRRSRWPTLLGGAASVVVAAGLAWQLRPDPPPTPFAAVMQETLPAPAGKAAPRNAAPAPATEPQSAPAPAPANAPVPVDAPASAAAPAAAPADAPSAGREPPPAAPRAEPRATVASPPQALRRMMPRPLSAEEVSAAVQADALLSRHQWLQRIRSRRDAGDIDVARASLERYLVQYPGTRVPRDLQALLSE